jgi:diadenylate cyclase
MNYIVHVVDILIVAYIFYRLFLLIRGTRAVQIILGLATLVVLTFLSKDVLHLNTLNWLLNRFWVAAVVILVVVFQPEIRSALAQLGSHGWSKIILPTELDFINEIADAAKECSQRQIGALIVLEQEVGLKTYIETGVMLNAYARKELLLSIFNPRSPLHDGAVIVQNQRIASASCVLPLSHEPIVSEILGTRHRAAIGLSEISDAIIIVVSEETGKVSVAKKGRLESNVDIEELRKNMLSLYRKKGETVLFG